MKTTDFVKINFKLLVGILALALASFAFFMSMRPTSLEEGDLRTWQASSESRRAVAVEILTVSLENNELMVRCIDRIATMPDAGRMKVRDAAALCAAGIALSENNNNGST
ncbi:MAG: hypothetical protein FWE17_02790 [Alphaproteobacteria bacterium]|nr:hypothetical protein [Alphaproteobacteria bacterium]MCL2758583.1 hypothetical protein [Alphaproteobacteria bacterium]